jgi:predicted nucleic acid-binding protein
VIAYLDSSVLARAYLIDEDGHDEAIRLLADPQVATVTGTWTRIEVSGALIRAARSGRWDAEGLLALVDADLSPDGPVSVLSAAQDHGAGSAATCSATRSDGPSPPLTRSESEPSSSTQ